MKKAKTHNFNDIIKEFECDIQEAKELFSMLQFIRIKPILEKPLIIENSNQFKPCK